MNYRVRRIFFTLLALTSVVLTHIAAASITVVGSCKSGVQWSTIQSAINAAPSGATIYICPGTYTEQLLINKSLTLTGDASNGSFGINANGAVNPVITSPGGGVVTNASNLAAGVPIAAQIAVVTPTGASGPIKVNLYYLAIDGSNNQLSGCGTELIGIYYQNASGTVDQVVTRNQELPPGLGSCQDGFAIYVESGYNSGGSATVTIENSNVHDYDQNGITADGSGTIATILGNYVLGQGAISAAPQNGIQLSNGATGSVKNNQVSDQVYINPPNCSANTPPYCYGAAGILIYDSEASLNNPVTISGNSISNTQLAIYASGDGAGGTADYNTVTMNKITGTQAAGVYLEDGIDLCSNLNSALSNTVFNSSGAGIHIDSSCVESGNPTGNDTSATKNTINEACAGVLTGSGTDSNQYFNYFYNVIQSALAGDSCPASGLPARAKPRLKPKPRQPSCPAVARFTLAGCARVAR
jgi:hypothetical protein